MRFKLIVAFLWFALGNMGAAHAAESDCDGLRKIVNQKNNLDESSKKAFFFEIDLLIKKDENCAKNLLGRMYFEGYLVPADKQKAHGIFYDLTLKNYPPSFYNLAYFFISENKGEPEINLNLLHGLMIKYSGDPEWGYISANSRELGWDYINQLEKSPSDKRLIEELKEQHRGVTENNVNQLAEAVKKRTRDVKSQSDTIMAVIAIGGAAVAISRSGILAPRGNYQSNLPTSMYLPSGAPNPRFYQFMPTANPGLLYGVPIY
jgi:hypothetical protein